MSNKILFVLNHFLPEKSAGTEIYVFNLATNLQTFGWNVQILIPNFNSSIDEHYIFNSVSVFKYAEPNIFDRDILLGIKPPIGFDNFKAHIKKINPDIVHFQELGSSNYISHHHIKFVKEIGLKTVVTFHLAGNTCKSDSLLFKDAEKCDGKIEINKCSVCYLHTKKKVKYFSKFVIFISEFLKKLHINPNAWKNKFGSLLGTNIQVLNWKLRFDQINEFTTHFILIADWYKEVLLLNGVSSNKISVIHQALATNYSTKKPIDFNKDDCLRLVFFGRVSEHKGLHILIQALENLKFKKVTLDIFGTIEDEIYARKCLTLSIKNSKINWKGSIAHQDVVDTMSQYHALCLCSTFSEMSPLVIQEAFAAGITVIASDVRGNSEQIQHGFNGLLFKMNQFKDLQLQIEKLLSNPDLIKIFKNNIIPPILFDLVAKKHDKVYQNMVS
jgi:glycosyltransferase involved in cell wall biosynthesis